MPLSKASKLYHKNVKTSANMAFCSKKPDQHFFPHKNRIYNTFSYISLLSFCQELFQLFLRKLGINVLRLFRRKGVKKCGYVCFCKLCAQVFRQAVFYKPCRIAGDYCIRRNVLCNDSTGCNNGIMTSLFNRLFH